MKNARRVLVATRSAHKLDEIRAILGDALGSGTVLVDLEGVGIVRDPTEERIEVFDSFRENALAKARYFAERSHLPTIADDSGIVVDALGGEPGVRSRRFAGRSDLAGRQLDEANNALLLERLRDVPAAGRGAHYVCAAALADARDPAVVAIGTCAGVILQHPAGSGGFGYDPLFHLPELDRTFGQLDALTKNRISHRARALRALAVFL